MAASVHPLNDSLEPEWQLTAHRVVEGADEYLTGTYVDFQRACRVAEMLEAAGWDTRITECP